MVLAAEQADAILVPAIQREDERERRMWEKRTQTGRIMPGEQLTQKQINERLWAFMFVSKLEPRRRQSITHNVLVCRNYKPTESDEEDDDEDDEDVPRNQEEDVPKNQEERVLKNQEARVPRQESEPNLTTR